MNVMSTITDKQKDKADHLMKILQDRFQQHLMAQLENKNKRTHWSRIFAHTNLAGSAACMILSIHVKNEIQCVTDADCLLQPNTHNFYQCLPFPSREGAYLYFNSNKGCFIRSGKVAGGGFTIRGKEHFKESKRWCIVCTSITCTHRAVVQEHSRGVPKLHLILSSKSSQLVGVQCWILQSCWTEIGMMLS